MDSDSLDTDIKELLMNTDEDFKRLALKHHDFDVKLTQLSNQPYLTQTEQIEEITLKKKKLMLKDQMQAIISRYRSERATENVS